ncbi:MAG TPA: amylo-alpha-1,6-glucosidase [Pyrinomonadaceae bacterium]|nr:amylo-alpha-1,6-glucosidase [Pyrinomonadaceae bacterium]
MRTSLIILLIFLISLQANSQEILYRTDAYTLASDGVKEGQFEAAARSRTEIASNYRSLYDQNIQIKFAVNGTLNDIADYENHRIFFSSEDDRVISPVYVFGQRESNDFIGRGEGRDQDGRTTVIFRLDLRPLLEAFKRQGYYEFYNLKRITPEEFKGVYLTGDRPPLVKAFEGLPSSSQFEFKDADGDGIYEAQVVFQTKGLENGGGKTQWSTWRLQKDISHLPQYSSSQLLIDALYAMSLEEMLLNIRPDGAFMAGKLWDGVWTRDISYSILLSLAILAPDVARESLMRKVSPDGRIIQDTGTGGSWPVSTDRMVWALAAWEIYNVTGDRQWLRTAYQIINKSAMADLKNARASNGLFYGESSFMDWREQSYPRWMDPKDIYQSQCLSTNAVHYQTYQILKRMAELTGQPAKEQTEVAASIKAAINKQMWMPGDGYYGEYLYGRHFQSLSPRPESLGEALSVLFDIADESQQQQIISNTPLTDFGVPDFSPQIPNMPAYHNNAIWPFVVGYWTWASAKARNSSAVEHGLGSIYRQAALFLTNKENMVATTGDIHTMLNSDRQLWSVAANLAMVYRIFFGMNFEPDRLTFRPFIPKSYKDTRTLKNFKYRAATLDITVTGYGDRISSVTLDGQKLTSASISGDIKGRHTLVITMANNDLPASKIKKVQVRFSPDTPTVSLSGRNLSWKPVEGAQKYFIYANGAKIYEASGTAFTLPENANHVEYQVMAVDAQGLQSFLSAPVEVSSPAEKIEIEAEAGKDRVRNQYQGYSGKGYLKLDKSENLTLDYRVNITKPGSYAIKFRYANGNGPVNTENKCAVRTLRLDARRIGAIVMPQRGTEWNNWGYSNSHLLDLTKGQHLIRVAFEDLDDNMNGAINEALLDKIELTFLK